MFKRLTLFACVLSLAGCSTITMEEKINNFSEGNSDYSYANNIARQMGVFKIKDTEVPKGSNVGGSSLGTDISLSVLGRSLPGGNAIGGSLGADLFFSIGKSLLKPTEPEQQVHILAFVSAKKYPTKELAHKHLIDEMDKTYRKAIKEVGFEISEMRVPKRRDKRYGADYIIYNESKGCPKVAYEDEDYYLKKCEVWMLLPSTITLEPMNPPQWLNQKGHQEKSWVFAKNSILSTDMLFSEKKDAFSHEKFWQAVSANLPERTFIYVPSFTKNNPENPKQEWSKPLKIHTPPYVADNKKVHYFVKEKQEKK